MTTLADIAQPVLIAVGVIGFLTFGYALAFGAVEYVAQRKIARVQAQRMAHIEELRKQYWGK